MARINIDAKFFHDGRISHLAGLTGLHRYMIEGKILRVWSHCYHQVSDELDAEMIAIQAEWQEKESFAQLMVRSNLAEALPDGRFRIKGIADRIEYLIHAQEKARYAGKKSVEARIRKYGDAKIRKSPEMGIPPKDEKIDSFSSSPMNIARTPGSSEMNPLTPAPAPAPALAPDRLVAADAATPPKKAKNPKVKKVVEPSPGAIAFQAYAHHYRIRYGIDPIRSAQVNSQAKAIAGSIPGDHIDGFFECYLKNPNAYYVQRAHPIGCAQSDCQKIYTEFLTGMRLSSQKARQFELVSENQEVLSRFAAKHYGVQESAKA